MNRYFFFFVVFLSFRTTFSLAKNWCTTFKNSKATCDMFNRCRSASMPISSVLSQLKHQMPRLSLKFVSIHRHHRVQQNCPGVCNAQKKNVFPADYDHYHRAIFTNTALKSINYPENGLTAVRRIYPFVSVLQIIFLLIITLSR